MALVLVPVVAALDLTDGLGRGHEVPDKSCTPSRFTALARPGLARSALAAVRRTLAGCR